jgi:hypothetical protein
MGSLKGRVEKWRGWCRSEACLFPGLSVSGAQVAVPYPRFHFPLIEPSGRFSRTRLSDKILMLSPTEGCA